MTKRGLIRSMAASTGEPESVCQRQLEAMIEAIEYSLAKGRPVLIRGFGLFEMRLRKPRAVKDWSKGTTVLRPAAMEARFRPGKRLKALTRKA